MKSTNEDIENTIIQILREADGYGLRFEVEEYAKKYLESDPDMDIVEAYNSAYYEWIK
jgi:hypothetical protein